VVLVQLEGGNDGLNTVIPLNGQQRLIYEALRPSIGIPTAEISGETEIDDDPTGLALGLHPAMTGLRQLYATGKVAVINAVGYPDQNLSHFSSEDIWFTADPSRNPAASPGTGWFGTYLDVFTDPSIVKAVSLDRTTTKAFATALASVIGVDRLSRFTLPDDLQYPDLEAKEEAWNAIYPFAASGSGLEAAAGQTGTNIVALVDRLNEVETSGWGSNVEALNANYRLNRTLRDAISIIRHDVLSPASDTGIRFFHVRHGGFDTHSRQEDLGSDPLNPTPRSQTRHGRLLFRASQSIKAFYDDLQALGPAVANRAVIMTFSEFGRRPFENSSGADSGTDHGAAAPAFVIGSQVNGGVYGALPSLDPADFDADLNLVFQNDFRRLYATVIERWLGQDPNAVIPNALPGEWSAIPGVLP
jgi:uncharacterized protein (DUF1501 family)